MSERVQVLSFGGGVQSNALLVLIAQGKLPPPAAAIIADTGFETGATWDYLAKYGEPLCKELGIKLVRVSRRDTDQSQGYTPPIATTKSGRKLCQIPVYTIGDHYQRGKAINQCTTKWKVAPLQWAMSREFPRRHIEQWIGFSTDEVKRAKRKRIDTTGKYRDRYPLIELGISRVDCIKMVRDYGWELPPRSSCYICPNHDNREWRHLRDNRPAEFAAAIKFDKWLRRQPIDSYDRFLHRDAVPLDVADIDDNSAQGDFFGCDSGHCFT